MAFRQSSPGETGGGAHFPFCKTPKDSTWGAWYAGGTQWTYTHGERPSKPCLAEITGGSLVCAKCATGARRDFIGYVPVYRCEDAKPCFIIVHLDQWDRVRTLRLHSPIVIGRGPDDGDGAWVRPNPSGPKYATTLPSRRVPADISESLLRVWKLPDLTSWWRANRSSEPTTPATVPAPEASLSDTLASLDDAREAGKVELELGAAQAARRFRVSNPTKADPPTIAESFPNLADRARATKPSENGNGKHTKPKS